MLDRKISESKRIAVLSQGKADGSGMEAVRYKGTFQKIFYRKVFVCALKKQSRCKESGFARTKKIASKPNGKPESRLSAAEAAVLFPACGWKMTEQ